MIPLPKPKLSDIFTGKPEVVNKNAPLSSSYWWKYQRIDITKQNIQEINMSYLQCYSCLGGIDKATSYENQGIVFQVKLKNRVWYYFNSFINTPQHYYLYHVNRVLRKYFPQLSPVFYDESEFVFRFGIMTHTISNPALFGIANLHKVAGEYLGVGWNFLYLNKEHPRKYTTWKKIVMSQLMQPHAFTDLPKSIAIDIPRGLNHCCYTTYYHNPKVANLKLKDLANYFHSEKMKTPKIGMEYVWNGCAATHHWAMCDSLLYKSYDKQGYTDLKAFE